MGYSPQPIGAEEFEILIWVDAGVSYEWDGFVVLRREDGSLYYTVGSGCSCNEMFDTVGSVVDLYGPFSAREIASKAQAWEREKFGYSYLSRVGLGTKVAERLMFLRGA